MENHNDLSELDMRIRRNEHRIVWLESNARRERAVRAVEIFERDVTAADIQACMQSRETRMIDPNVGIATATNRDNAILGIRRKWENLRAAAYSIEHQKRTFGLFLRGPAGSLVGAVPSPLRGFGVVVGHD